MKKIIITISIFIIVFVSIPQKAIFEFENTDRALECKANIWYSYSVSGSKLKMPKDIYFTADPVKPVELYFPFSVPTYFNILKNNIGI